MIVVMASYCCERDYLKAVEAALAHDCTLSQRPPSYRWLAALTRAIEISPASFEFFVKSRSPCFYPEDWDHMLEGLCRAGWQG
jgi:hypothetical protein